MKTYGPYFTVTVLGNYRPIAGEHDLIYIGHGDYKGLLNIIKEYNGYKIDIRGYSFINTIIRAGDELKNDIKNNETFSIIAEARYSSETFFKRYDYLGKDYLENIINAFSKKYESKVYSKRMITEEIIKKNENDKYIREVCFNNKIWSIINEVKGYSQDIYRKEREKDYSKDNFLSQEYDEAISSFKNSMLQKYFGLKKEIDLIFKALIELNCSGKGAAFDAQGDLHNYFVHRNLLECFGEEYKVYNIDVKTISKTIKSFCKADIICLDNVSDTHYQIPKIFKPVSKVIYHSLPPEKESEYHADKRAFNLYGFFRDKGNCNSEYPIGNYTLR